MSNISLLRLPAVMARTGKSRSMIYLEIKKNRFPKPVKISRRSVAWPSDVIDKYIEDTIKAGGD